MEGRMRRGRLMIKQENTIERIGQQSRKTMAKMKTMYRDQEKWM